MWKCQKCGEKSRDDFDSCWNCGTSQDESPPVDANVFKLQREEAAKRDDRADYMTTYATARLIAQLVSFVGWVVVIISAMILVVSLAKSRDSGGFDLMMGLLPSFSGLISGLLLVMFGQITRATLDTADNTGQILALMKKRKGNKVVHE